MLIGDMAKILDGDKGSKDVWNLNGSILHRESSTLFEKDGD